MGMMKCLMIVVVVCGVARIGCGWSCEVEVVKLKLRGGIDKIVSQLPLEFLCAGFVRFACQYVYEFLEMERGGVLAGIYSKRSRMGVRGKRRRFGAAIEGRRLCNYSLSW